MKTLLSKLAPALIAVAVLLAGGGLWQLHSWVRWLAIGAGVAFLVAAILGFLVKADLPPSTPPAAFVYGNIKDSTYEDNETDSPNFHVGDSDGSTFRRNRSKGPVDK
jgi:cytochrome oxidase Cu insertion factor (SCO1/SenC/PrrC family)